MNKLRKKEGIGIILLAVLTIFAGYMVYFQKDFKVETNIKTDSNKNLSSYYYFGDDYYDYDYDYDYDDEYYTDDDYYYDDYYYQTSYTSSSYYDNSTPLIEYPKTRIVDQYSDFDPKENVYVNGRQDTVKILYNNVDINNPGQYTIVYKGCNNSGRNCKTFSTQVTVQEVKDDDYTYNSYEALRKKGPQWSNTDSVTCNTGATTCKASKISKPTATDPVTNKSLTVELINGSVDVYTPGTYVLIYYAETSYGVSGTTSKIVTIKGTSSSYYYDDEDDYYYYDDEDDYYYDDDYYYNYSSSYSNSKYISNYEWSNRVGYTYRCDNVDKFGTEGWTLVSVDTSNGVAESNADDHPTIYYSQGIYEGTLNRVYSYCKSGCDAQRITDLGVCKNQGETKQVYSTWIGVYEGTVYKKY